HKHALTSPHLGCPVKKLIRGRPVQNQRAVHTRVSASWHAGEVAGPERAIGGVRAQNGHIGDALADMMVAHAISELIDFTYNIIAQHECQSLPHCLRVKVAPDHYVCVLET